MAPWVSKKPLTSLALACASLLVGLAIFEGLSRLVVQQSDRSWGRIGTLELPPMRLLSGASLATIDPHEPYGDLRIGGQTITRSDLFGILRRDAVAGYSVQENALSTNGWWQSNNIGARAMADTTTFRPEGQRRALVFGESFTQGSRVKQNESWPYFFGEMAALLDVVNLAVDGYSMGQAYLRYRQLRDYLDHDVVVLGFVPSQDLIRDVNTLRTLIGWESSTIFPRFVLNGNELQYVPSPYADRPALTGGGVADMDERLLSHLKEYDSFFFPDYVSLPTVVGRLVAYKIVLRGYQMWRHQRLARSMLDPESEAIRTVRAIIDAMARESADRNTRFVLVYIPSRPDIRRIASEPGYAERWRRVVDFCPSGAICIDLSTELRASAELDAGYDGTHYGPRANHLVASIVTAELAKRGLIETRK